MSLSKSEQKKEFILDRATDVFIKKGFASVTMKDIVEACEISRGGLYRYFGSTRAVFMDIFIRDTQSMLKTIEIFLWENLPAEKILKDYLYKRKAAMLKPSLILATYEFFIENPDDQVIFQWQFDNFVESIRELLTYGIKKEEFIACDATAYARHMVLFLSNMQISAPLLKIPEAHIDEQFTLLVEPILPKSKRTSEHKIKGKLQSITA